MKYHLDTIPVWDAYHEDKECPLCILEDNSEKSYVDSFLGGSVMEPDTRIEVNEKGFCPHHNKLLYKAQNRLGLALMTHTHTLETIEKMKKKTAQLSKDVNSPEKTSLSGSLIRKLSSKEAGLDKSILELSDWLRKHRDRCIICDRINYSLNRYAYTILHLWENDEEFRKIMNKSKGFCFSHLPIILDMAVENLNSKKQAALLSDLLPLQMENMERLEKELHWFTLKFDYRNQDKSWGNSKDAVPRIIQKLTGESME